MGRLFWKFFLALWLAFLVAGVGVGTAVWLRHLAWDAKINAEADHSRLIDNRHSSALVLVAESAIRYGDMAELSRFLKSLQDAGLPQVYAVDDQGREVLGRDVNATLLQQVRSLLADDSYANAIRLVTSKQGDQYLLFVPEHRFYRKPLALMPELDVMAGFRQKPNMPPDFRHGPDGPPPDHDFQMGAAGPGGSPPGFPRSGGRPPEPPSPITPILACTIVSLIFSIMLARYFSKPIRSLRDAFAALASGKLDTRVGGVMGNRRDELSDLGRDFDHMAVQVGNLVQAQQRLLHDVSHELRSPLARIQAAIGLAQQQPEKVLSTLERIERESQRISDLVGELLVLSRLEAGVSLVDHQEFDLGGLLEDIVEDADFEAKQYQLSINFQGIDKTLVNGCGELLHRAIENVLRNAMQHSIPGARVWLTAKFDVKSRHLQLRIEDQGPGVAESDLSAIFQPFFRSGQASKPNGVGLGLAIAQRAIAVHGGTIKASNRAEGGLRVDIEIPFIETDSNPAAQNLG